MYLLACNKCLFQQKAAKYRFVPDEEIKTTEEDNIFKYSDWDNFIFEIIDDDTFHISGFFKFNIDFPRKMYTLKVWSQVFQNGKWNPGPIGMNFPDYCSMLKQSGTTWYSITKNFTKCMPKKGVSLESYFSKKKIVYLFVLFFPGHLEN